MMTTTQLTPLPTVSVVIPAYNAMNYLPETLDSALNQTFQDFEIVIINDGSTDQIETWIGQLNHPKVRLISQENRGLAAARNAGILAAHGELIAFLDADDLWAPNKLAAQVEMFARSPGVGLVYSWIANINAQGKETGRVLCSTAEGNLWPELLRGNCIGCGSVPMVRRECFEVLGAFDTQLGSSNEDWDMWLRLAAVYPIQVVKEVLVYYRQHPNSASRNWLQMERTSKIVLEKTFSAWGKGDGPRQAPKDRIPHLYHQQIKREAYGNTYLSLAWQPLQCRQKNLRESLRLLSIALGHRRNIVFSKEFLRLGLAIVLTAVFRDQYSQILHQLQQARYRINRLRQPRRSQPARTHLPHVPQLPNRQPAETVASKF